MLVETLQPPAQILDAPRLHDRFLHFDLSSLVAHPACVALALDLLEKLGERIGGVVATWHHLDLYVIVRHLLLDPPALHLDMPCLTREASTTCYTKCCTGVTPSHGLQNNTEVLTDALHVQCMLRMLAHYYASAELRLSLAALLPSRIPRSLASHRVPG